MNVLKYIELRRQLHRNPELSNQEKETTYRICEFLNSEGLNFMPFQRSYGGFVKIDVGAKKTVCFRADIDALPLSENTGAEFSSEKYNVMHACGHDMHTGIAVGVACELNKVKEALIDNVIVLFQPAEEDNPKGGAKSIVNDNFLENQKISEIYGIHMWPSLPVGDIELRPGPIMAASDRFIIVVNGKNAHAAEAHLGVDAISIASEIDLALTSRLRREISPFDNVIIAIGSFQSFGRYNVICDKVILEGTVRTVHEKTRSYIHKRIKEIATSIAQTYGGISIVNINPGYGVVNNDYRLFKKFSNMAIRNLGNAHVHTDSHPSLIGEDFYYYGTKIPSLYIHVGCESNYPLHSNCFLPKEETMEFTIQLMTDYFLNADK